EKLTDRGVGLRVGIGRERLCARVEPDDGVRAEVGEPHDVLIVDVHGVGHRIRPGELPFPPGRVATFGLELRDLTGIPFADPDVAAAVAPYAARALTLRRWVGCGHRRRGEVDQADLARRERGVVDVAVGAGADAVRTRAAGRGQDG